MFIVMTEEEREWVHNLAKRNKSAIPKMVMDLLDEKSKEFGIPLPTNRAKRIKYYTQELNKTVSGRKKFMEKIDRGLGLL